MSDPSPLSSHPSSQGRWRDKLRHAFAVEPTAEGDATISAESQELANRIADKVARRGMAVPAVMLLEMSRPLNYVAAQALHGLTPLLGSLVGDARVRGFAELLEQRGAVDYLCQRLESPRPDAPDQPAS